MTEAANLDTALQLKQLIRQGESVSPAHAHNFLERSETVQRLSQANDESLLAAIWQLNAFAEIPFSDQLPETQALIQRVLRDALLPEGFSITGKRDDIFPCYNAMIAAALIRLGVKGEAVEHGIGWILKHQAFERGQSTSWTGKGIQKYGGCLKATPCYIGIVKSLDALTAYSQAGFTAHDVTEKRNLGLEYMLDHHLYQRLSDQQPITPSLLKLSYPFSYRITLVELLRILQRNERLQDERCHNALKTLRNKRKRDGYWRVNDSISSQGYMNFDARGQPGCWLSDEISSVLNKIDSNTTAHVSD